MNLTEATMKALKGELNEVKSSDKLWTCIEDRQYGDFAVGETMTAEEWGETAYGWAYSDDWTDPEEPLLKNFGTEQECINFIDDMWEITIVPSDDPRAKKFLGKKQEAVKDDNNDYSSVYVDQKETLSDGSYHMRLSSENHKVWINVEPYKGNGTVKWDYDFDSIKSKRDKEDEDFINTSVDVNDIDEAILEAISDKKQEARSHKEDNERVAPRENTNGEKGYVKGPLSGGEKLYGKIDVPKRAIFHKKEPYNDGTVWGEYDKSEVDTYEKGTPDIERYKELKDYAEDERLKARQYNKRADIYDDMASDVVRDKKLDRARRVLKGKNIFELGNKKTESKETSLDSQAYWAYVLGYDLMHDKLKQEGPECDTTFEKAWKIADDFMKSDEFKNTNKSGYDALVDYLKNNNLI